MIAYKGFNQDLTCTSGKGTYQYAPGVTEKEKKRKNKGSRISLLGISAGVFPLVSDQREKSILFSGGSREH